MTTPATPDPTTPVPSTTAPAASTTATPDTSTAVRDLATTLDAPSPVYASLLKAVVTASAATASPPTISVQISGDTTTTIDGVRYNDSYSPVVGDTILVGKQGPDMFGLCQLNNSGSGAANGWQTPVLGTGFTTGGNSNGPIFYRVVLDSGDLKMQWKGSVAVSGAVTAVCTVPTGFRPSAKCSLIAARDPGGGSDVIGLDFNTDGTVVLVGTTTFGSVTGGATTASGGDTTGASGGDATGSAGGGTTDSQGSHTHINTDDHTHSHGGAVATTSFVDSTAQSSGSHTHTVTGTHTHTQPTHTHTQPTHTHSFAPTGAVTAPVWVSFNNVEYYL